MDNPDFIWMYKKNLTTQRSRSMYSKTKRVKKRPPSDFLITNFEKVRLTFIRNKRGDIVDKIDGSDFRFATFNKVNTFMTSSSQKESLWDASPFGCAYASKIDKLSELKIDMRNTPFTLDQTFDKYGDFA